MKQKNPAKTNIGDHFVDVSKKVKIGYRTIKSAA